MGTPEFASAAEECGFWTFFDAEIAKWNAKAVADPGVPLVRTRASDLANRTIRLFRDQYRPDEFRRDGFTSGVQSRPVRQGTDTVPAAHFTEHPVAHPFLPLTGIIDLAGNTGKGTVIVDFKTGERRPEHREQLEVYAVLWWRTTGEAPLRTIIQYLDGSEEWTVGLAALEARERTLTETMTKVAGDLQCPPGPARTGPQCRWCAVRARCDEGWSALRVERAGTPRATDVEGTVASQPTRSGCVMKVGDSEMSIVFDDVVRHRLPNLTVGDRVRIVNAYRDGDAIRIGAIAGLYRVGRDAS